MPVASAPPTQATHGPLALTVHASAAVELHWVTARGSDELDPAAGVDSRQRLDTLWGLGSDATSTEASLPELLVLADRAGVLASEDPAAVVQAVAAEAGRMAERPRLRSEPPADRLVIVGRLDALATDAALRRRWIDFLTGAAEAMEERWRSVGLDAARRAVRARTSQLPWTDPATAVMEWAGRDYGGLLPDLLDDAARTGRPVLVVPAYWSGQGLLFDLVEHLLVGISARPGPAGARARVEPWVPGLKAMADPTRLAILDHLASHARSVGELANDFGLAQPTVSRHIRLLRDADLLSEVDGTPRRYRADGQTIGRLLAAIEASLVSRPSAEVLPEEPLP